LLAPEPDSAMAASATSLLQAAIGSVLPSSTTEEAPVGSEKGALIGAEEAAPGCHGATLLLEGPKILPGKRTLISSLYFNSFPFAFFVCLDEAFGSADQPSVTEEQPMMSADSEMEMGRLPVAEEAPSKGFMLSADWVKSAQENLSEC